MMGKAAPCLRGGQFPRDKLPLGWKHTWFLTMHDKCNFVPFFFLSQQKTSDRQNAPYVIDSGNTFEGRGGFSARARGMLKSK